MNYLSINNLHSHFYSKFLLVNQWIIRSLVKHELTNELTDYHVFAISLFSLIFSVNV